MPNLVFPSTDYADALIALALRFGATDGESAPAIVEAVYESLPAPRREALGRRAGVIAELDGEKQMAWRDRVIGRISRSCPEQLDANVNPSHIVDILANESATARRVILESLPADLSRRVALYLDVRFSPPTAPVDDHNGLRKVVCARFLANFTAFDELASADELDRFTVDELETFTRHLGLREIAIACRGIAAKETLAAFLNRFDADDAREIVRYVTELDKIRPFWVAQADALVRKSWNAELPPASVVRRIGLKILAAAFILRDDAQLSYAAQKLPSREAAAWRRTVKASRRRYFSSTEEDRPRLDKRRRIVERLAVKFRQTGRL